MKDMNLFPPVGIWRFLPTGNMTGSADANIRHSLPLSHSLGSNDGTVSALGSRQQETDV